MAEKNKLTKLWIPIALFFAVGLYSFSAVFSKFSAAYKVFSFKWILLYGCSMVILVIYSVIWQLILEHISLSSAYMSKGFYYLFVLLWSFAIFHEQVKWTQILGVVIITVGIVVGKQDGDR